MITRYRCYSDGADMWEEDDGEWVHIEDHEKIVAKARELLREAAAVYRLYNATQQPDGNIVDEQTLQELSDLIDD